MEALMLDFTGILALIVFFEALFVVVKTRNMLDSLNEEAIHHIGTHLLLKIGFIFAIISFKMLDDAIFISVWGIYAFWHIHVENKSLMSGKHYI